MSKYSKMQDVSLDFASRQGLVDQVRDMLAAGETPEDDTLPYTATFGHTDCIKELLSCPRDDVRAILHKTKDRGLWCAANCGHLEIVKMLVAFGANPTYAKSYRFTCIETAKKKGYTEIVTFLLKSIETQCQCSEEDKNKD